MFNSSPRGRPQTLESWPLLEAGLVGAGGAIGAVLRAVVVALCAAAGAPGLVATQVVNLTGAFVLGVFVAGFEVHGLSPSWRVFFAVGVVGSYTTFSTLVGEQRDISAASSAGVALLFLAASLTLGIVGFLAGQLAGERVFAPATRRAADRESARNRMDPR